MSVKNTIKDGTGSALETKVKKAGALSENSVCVNLSGASSGFGVQVLTSVVGTPFSVNLTNGGSDDMGVDGSSTPVVFSFVDLVETGKRADFDVIIQELHLIGFGGSIKLGNFLNESTPLTNGLLFTQKSDNISTTPFNPITRTHGIEAWSSISGFSFIAAAGGDSAKGVRILSPALLLRSTNKFGVGNDDFLSLTVRDDLASLTGSLICNARGIYIAKDTL